MAGVTIADEQRWPDEVPILDLLSFYVLPSSFRKNDLKFIYFIYKVSYSPCVSRAVKPLHTLPVCLYLSLSRPRSLLSSSSLSFPCLFIIFVDWVTLLGRLLEIYASSTALSCLVILPVSVPFPSLPWSPSSFLPIYVETIVNCTYFYPSAHRSSAVTPSIERPSCLSVF